MIPVLLILGGFVLLTLGGEGTVRGASSVAERLKVPPFVIGATVVAFGTSVPELVVTLTAGLRGSEEIALGNVVGSNIANLGFILGLAALVRPVEVSPRTFRFEIPQIIGVMLLLVLFGWNGHLGRFEGISLLVFVLVVAWRTMEGLKGRDKDSSEPGVKIYGWFLSVVMLVIGIGALIWGGHLLVEGAVQIARALGVSEWVIGVVIVSVGTSLPEVAASVTAAAKGQGDLAIGNVFGSNTFNVLFVLGTGASIHPMTVQSPIHLDLILYAGLTLLPFAFLAIRSRLSRTLGAVMLAAYIVYVVIKFGYG